MQTQTKTQKSLPREFSPRLSRFFQNGKFTAAILLLFILKIGLPAQQPDPLKKLPAAQNPRTLTLDVQHVALDLQFDFSKKQAFGTAEITFAPLAETSEIALDAGFLSVNSVVFENGQQLKFENKGGDLDENLKIALPQKRPAGQKLTLKIEYRTNHHNDSDPNNIWGSYGKGLRFFNPTTTEPRKRRQIWSMGEPQGNRYWFPGLDAPGDFRTFEIRATVGGNLSVVSNGELVSETKNADGTTTFHWRTDTPHANHQSSIVVGEYEVFEQSTFQWQRRKIPFPLFEGGRQFKMRSFGYPDEMEALRATVIRLPEMITFFSGITDYNYPQRTYNQVFVQDFPWGGGPGIGTSTISENMVDDFGTHADFFYLWDGVEAQDLAGQWFGHLLVPADWSEAWLSKSFQFYFDCLFTEDRNGHDEMLLWNRNFQHATCMADWQSGIRRPIVTRHFDDAATMCFDNFPLRGALVLHILRKQLGEKKWQRAIRSYVKKHAGRSVSTADFQREIEAAAGKPMDWFFEQWVYGIGHPVFEIFKSYDPGKRRLTLTIKQLQKNDPAEPWSQTEFFQGKIEVEIDERIETIWLEPKAENTFTFAVKTEPQLVNFDFENTWFRELKFERTLNEWLYLLQSSKDAVARRAALFEVSAIFKNEKTSGAEKLKIREALRSVILGKSYWRLRLSALTTLQNLVGGEAFDSETEAMLLQLIKTEKSWLRSGAITFLGMAKDSKHAELFIQHFRDSSDRVVNAAANALGKTKSPAAFEALLQLKDRPSWKNQSLISTLNGLRELGDPRGAVLALESLRDENAAPRWTLATSVWDFRLAAAETLVALGKAEEGYPIAHQRFMKSMEERDVNDIFGNVLVLVTLGDARGLAVFPLLRERFSGDANALKAVDAYESQLREVVGK